MKSSSKPSSKTPEIPASAGMTKQLSNVTVETAKSFGLTEEEYNKILELMGRVPNMVELGIFSVMWSEHCSYKTTRKHLSKLPTKAPHVICGPGENAGVIDIGDGQAAIFKMESHNHPSYIEPFQGAATGVGGILRDVFTMGARPIANMNALRFGSPDHPKTRQLVSGVVSGIGFYGNCVGVPTVGGECIFHPSYNGNILVNAMTVGIASTDKIFYSKAAGVGNPVVYVGSKTGRDGIHAATMASAEFTEDSESKRPTVQIGDPFTEKLLIEACLELMATDTIVAIQDMGAAGLTSSSLEMAGKGGLGIELEMDKVPMREEGMNSYELMLSESQERMLMILKPGKEHIAEAIFKKWDLAFAVIGKLTDTGKLVLKMHGEVTCELPVDAVGEGSPIYDRPHVPTPKRETLNTQHLTFTGRDMEEDLITLLSSPDLCSKRWIWSQYDHMVGNDTVARPGGDSAVVRVRNEKGEETKKALAITTDCTPRYVYADPVEGGKQAVTETWRNLTAVGATPLAITNCLNFGNPQRPEIMGQITGALEGMREACLALDYPIISGNVSLYNETTLPSGTQAVQPTPAIGGVGILKDVGKRVGSAFTEADQAILLIGETRGHLGSSIYLREIFKREDGAPPPVDLAAERKHGDFVREQIQSGNIQVCHDLSDGGLLVALAEMCLPRGVGASVAFPKNIPPFAYAFGEDQGRYLVTLKPADVAAFLKEASAKHITVTELGNTGSDYLMVDGLCEVALPTLQKAHEEWLPKYMQQ